MRGGSNRRSDDTSNNWNDRMNSNSNLNRRREGEGHGRKRSFEDIHDSSNNNPPQSSSSAEWRHDRHTQEDYAYTSRRIERRIASSIGAVHGINTRTTTTTSTTTNNSAAANTTSTATSLRRKTEEIIPETSKPAIQEAYIQPEILNRNKRMFGSLMGHLGHAKRKLEEDSSFLEKQSMKLQSAQHRNEEEKKRIEEERKRQIQEEVLDKKITSINNLTTVWKINLEAQKDFLFTETEPRLSWLPAHSNQISRQLLDKRHNEVLRKIAERDMEDNKVIKELRMKAVYTTIPSAPIQNNEKACNNSGSGGDGQDEEGEEKKTTEEEKGEDLADGLRQEGKEELNASEPQEETLVEDSLSSDKLTGESEAQEERKEGVVIME
eukprot:gene4525-4963_t